MKYWEIKDAEDKITREAIKGSASSLVPENATLIVNRSGILKHTLPVAIARRAVAINQDLKALIPGPRAHPEYIAHMVKAAEPIVLSWVRATTADNFPIDNLRSLEIPFPPLAEQRRIAAILDRADALRRKRKRFLDLLGSLSQSIFREMFGEMKEDVAGHSTVPFGGLVDSQRIGLVRSASELREGAPTPYLRMNAITLDGQLDLSGVKYTDVSAAELREYELRDGDFLFNTRNSKELVGKSTVFRGPRGYVYNNNILRVRFGTKLLPEYAVAFFQTPFARSELEARKSGTTSVYAIYQKSLEAVPVVVPALEKQACFVDRLARIKAVELPTENQEGGLDSLFASLQHRAFSGQL